MYADIIIDLTSSIKKLHTLEDSIISEEKMDSAELRSKQALLISEIIQSLQDVENILKRETQFTLIPKRHSVVSM